MNSLYQPCHFWNVDKSTGKLWNSFSAWYGAYDAPVPGGENLSSKCPFDLNAEAVVIATSFELWGKGVSTISQLYERLDQWHSQVGVNILYMPGLYQPGYEEPDQKMKNLFSGYAKNGQIDWSGIFSE